MTLDRSFLLTGTALAMGIAAPALAQEGTPPTASGTSTGLPDTGPTSEAATSPGAALGDIVVTARRRDEALQNVPVAITALSATQLEQRGVRSVEDLRTATPGLNINGQRRDEANFYLRGQAPGVITAGARNFTSVATYFAEVPSVISGPGTFYDLANVQVLKGPQGTLFGRNTTGGAVLFEPARPTQEIEGYVQATYGNYDLKQVQFMLNAPFVPDVAALRLAGEVSRRDGYTRSIVTGQKLDGRKYEAIRASLLLTPGDNFQNLTIVDYRNKDNSSTGLQLRSIVPSAPLGSVATPASLAPLLGLPAGTSVTIPIRAGGTVPVPCLSAALPGCPTGAFGNAVAAFQAAFNRGNFADPANGGFALVATTAQLQQLLATQAAIGPRRTQIADLTRSTALNWGITNKTTLDLSDTITLKNIIAFRSSRVNDYTDYDGTPVSTITQQHITSQLWSFGQDQFTEEFQIQGKIPSINFSYILGYYHEFSKPGLNQLSRSIQFGAASTRIPSNKDKSDAVFGHFEWQPSDAFGLSGGIRQTWDKRQSTLSQFNAAGACTVNVPDPQGSLCPSVYNAKFDGLTYDVTANIKPSDRALFYAAYRRGYKSGGFTQPAPVGFQVFQPEKVDDYEVGFKIDWDIGVPLRTNFSAFYDKYSDVQISSPTLIGGSITSIIQNVGKQTNKGVEFEAVLVPFTGFTLGGFFSYTSAVSDVAVTSPTGFQVIVPGRQVPNSPKYKYGVNGSWRLPIETATGGDITLSADYSWQSRQNSSDRLAPINFVPSYGVANARLEWRDAFTRGIDLAAFVTNFTDKTYILGGFPLASQLGFESVFYGEPRMYGGSIRVRWGGN